MTQKITVQELVNKLMDGNAEQLCSSYESFEKNEHKILAKTKNLYFRFREITELVFNKTTGIATMGESLWREIEEIIIELREYTNSYVYKHIQKLKDDANLARETSENNKQFFASLMKMNKNDKEKNETPDTN